MLAERAQVKGIELAGSIPPDVPALLRSDPGRLRQILTNLLNNAIKFTEKGEVVLRVSKVGETDGYATIRFDVTDTGIGIPPEVQKRLFQAFSQADASTTRRYGGTGLGLAIAKQLVTIMEGKIGVHSEPGKGSTFWFSAQFEKQAGPPRQPEKRNRTLYNHLRVLVVDDNATNRQILRHQLFAWKMEKGSAASGYEALKILRAAAAAGTPYHLALLDMQMPEMDGLTLARAIKSEPEIANTRLIILTSLGKVMSTEEFKSAGIDAYLVKPVKQSRLFDAVVSAMGSAAAVEMLGKAACAAHPGVPPDPSLPALRIIVAEDNDVNQKVALGQLQRLGYPARAVTNGLEVLEALEETPCDVIFMDCQMPKLDGFETTRLIRKRETETHQTGVLRRPVHIVAMTADAMQGDRERCIEAGMNDYVSKPVHLGELRAALERLSPHVL
jgi:CheY-like chemotaxis protein